MKLEKLKKWWEWFNPDRFMYEFRIKNYQMIKYIHNQTNIPYSVSGLYINNFDDYCKIVKLVGDGEVCWLSVNPKKQVIGKYGYTYTGKDVGIESLNHLFIDIDPVDKNDDMDRIEKLKKMWQFVKILLTDLKEQNIKNYCVICSGYGWQMLIKLDVPLHLPNQTWDKENQCYIQDSKFQQYKQLVKKTFMARLKKKYNKLAGEYLCEIDKSCGNLGRVFAAPATYNTKYGKKVERKVVCLKNDEDNKGLSDWLFDELENIKTQPVYNNKIKKTVLASEFRLSEKNLVYSKLVQFILKNDLPTGMANNWLIFQLKCLIKDNGINFNSEVVRHIKMLIDKKWNTSIPFNLPDDRFKFNPNVVNNYCIYNQLPLLYKFYYEYKPTRPRDINKTIYTYNNYEKYPLKKLDVKLTEGDLVKSVWEIKKKVDRLKDNDKFMQELYSCLYFVEMSYDESTVKYILKEIAPYYFDKVLL